MATSKGDDGSLQRLGGGRWRTRDERFTIEPQSGTWVVVDGEQTDDLGLPLVRGPFASLAAAKAAIAGARESAPAVSPLAARVAELRARPAAIPSKREPGPPVRPEPPAEPQWLSDLEPAERRRAHELIDRLARVGAPDPEGMARRELAGTVPVVAGFAIARALRALEPEAQPAAVVRLLAEGRDAGLEVRWRLVDGDGRPITFGPDWPDRA